MQTHARNEARMRRCNGRRVVALGVCALLCCVATRPTAAAFVGGVEQFNGTVKDPVTWEEHNPITSNNTITQNDVINFRFAPDPAGVSLVDSNYAARTESVGVGQGARVDVRVNSATAPVTAVFYLTDNSAGPGRSVMDDANFIELNLLEERATSAGVGRGGNGRATGIATIPGAVPMTPGARYTLQIERPDLNTARFSVFDAAGGLIGSDTEDVTGLRATLFPAFGVRGVFLQPIGGSPGDYSIDFDNVTIIPEPASLALFSGVLVPLLLARRRCPASAS